LKKIGIISDDLTGANDSGVQLTEKGITTSVFFDIPTGRNHLDEGIVINTNSRALSVPEAISKNKQSALYLKNNGYKYIYKKMDSTIRGHIAEEVDIISKEIKSEFVFVAPAFPALGRKTVNGSHYLNDKRIEETEVSNDPVHPVKNSHLPTIFSKVINEKVATLTFKDIRNGFEKFKEKVNEFKQEDINYIVCDAEKESDLKLASLYMMKISDDILWVGSAGLAEVLPDVLGISNQNSLHQDLKSNQVLTISGSLSEVSQQQLQYAMSKEGMRGIEINTVKVFDQEWDEYSSSIVKSAKEILNSSSDLLVYLPSNEKIREAVVQKARENGYDEKDIGNIISESISMIAYRIVSENSNINGLVLSGGDTAKGVADKLGGIGIQLIKQVETGIPLGTLIDTSKKYHVVTKAGAFGHKKSIYKAMMELKGVMGDE